MSNKLQPSSDLLIKSFEHMKKSIRTAIVSQTNVLPLYKPTSQLDCESLTFNLKKGDHISLNGMTLKKIVRILQLIEICLKNLSQGRSITKRNLFYRLVSFYEFYGAVNTDVQFILSNLYWIVCQQFGWTGCTIGRSQIGIVASNRCIIFGRISLEIDGKVLSNINNIDIDVITVPTCKTIHPKSPIKKMIIIQKESMFYELVTLFRASKLTNEYILITAKGYPDQLTRRILSEICQEIEIIYYLGDFDVFGFDIFMFYTIGDWICEGILKKISIIKLGKYFKSGLFNWNDMQIEMVRFNKSDFKKIEEMKVKWFSGFKEASHWNELHQRMQDIENYFNEFIQQDQKCELQLFSTHSFNKNWVIQIIKLQQKQPSK